MDAVGAAGVVCTVFGWMFGFMTAALLFGGARKGKGT